MLIIVLFVLLPIFTIFIGYGVGFMMAFCRGVYQITKAIAKKFTNKPKEISNPLKQPYNTWLPDNCHHC
jgi:hypothetical protein